MLISHAWIGNRWVDWHRLLFENQIVDIACEFQSYCYRQVKHHPNNI